MSGIVLHGDLWPKQIEALESEATEILYGGATRCGKSHFARVQMIAGCLNIPNLQCTLIRKKFQDILDNHVYGKNGFKDILAPLIESGHVTVTQEQVSFWNGARIVFKHCQDERQFDSAQGIATQILVIDEATQISEKLINTFRGWCTITEEMRASMPEFFKTRIPRILYTANPVGVSVGYFRRQFVRARPPMVIEQVGAFKRQYIPAKVQDNPSEDAVATAGRMAMIGDEALGKALLEGDWEAPVGDFFPEWDSERHVFPDFVPPKHWQRWRSFDWGSTDPFAVLWGCTADGQPFETSEGKRWLPKGAIIIYQEWYGCDEKDPSRGIGMRNREIAKGIRDLSEPGFERVTTLTDSLPFQDRGNEFNIAEVFALEGCMLTEAATARVPGWSSVRDGLKGKKISVEDKEATPLLYVTRSCKYLQEYIPALPRHPTKPRDAAEEGEPTHICDALRYLVHGRLPISEKEQEKFDPTKPWTPTLSNIPTFNQALDIIKKGKARGRGESW
jgi:hypothetical protein